MDFCAIFCYTEKKHGEGWNEMQPQKKETQNPSLLLENILILAAVLLFAVLCAVLLFAKMRSGGNLYLSVNSLFPLLIVSTLGYFGCLLRTRRTGNRESLLRYFEILFFVYLFVLTDFTLLNPSFGRNPRELPRNYYMEMFTNFTPFYSIYTVYIRGFIEGKINVSYLILNLLGNLCILMPLSLFLPILWKKQRKFYVFLPTVLLIGIGIEGTQFLTMRGSCDVDDVILNVGGAIICFFLLRIPPVSRLINLVVTGTKKVDKTQ